MIPNLSAQIQVELSNQESVFDPRQALKFPPLHVFNDFVKTDRRSRSVGGRDVTRPVKLSEIFVRRLAVSWSEFPLENFSADSVDRASEVAVGYGGISGFDAPQRLAQSAHRCGRIEHDFCPVDGEHEPVEGVVAAVAYVYSDFAEFCLLKTCE